MIDENDPEDLVEELFSLWSNERAFNTPLEKNNGVNVEGMIAITRKGAIYQILALCASLLIQSDEKGEKQWRQRMAHMTLDALK